MKVDNVNRPKHYHSHPSGHEAITFAGEMNFALGNAFKYLFRAGFKGDAVEDMKKAVWYLKYERETRDSLWYKRQCPEHYYACEAGPPKVVDMLSFERRFAGHMKQALERVWAAHTYKRSTETLTQAIEHINACIRRQEALGI